MPSPGDDGLKTRCTPLIFVSSSLCLSVRRWLLLVICQPFWYPFHACTATTSVHGGGSFQLLLISRAWKSAEILCLVSMCWPRS